MSNLVTLFIGNLDQKTNAESLGKLLESCGAVNSVTIATRNNVSQRYGFAKMESNAAAQNAINKLNKYVLDGKELRVEFSNRGGPYPTRERDGRSGTSRFGFDNRRGGGFNDRFRNSGEGRIGRSGGYQGVNTGFTRRAEGGIYGVRRADPYSQGSSNYNQRDDYQPYGRWDDRRPLYERGDIYGRIPFTRGRNVPLRRRPPPSSSSSSSSSSVRPFTGSFSKTRVFVNNLPVELTAKELSEPFSDYKVKEVSIRPSRFQINRNAGFGFIELETEEEQQRLLKDHPDIIIQNRTCHCHPAHDIPAQQKKE